MSSLKWLEAGATASYGTVVEPCSFPQKFPSLQSPCSIMQPMPVLSKPTGKALPGRVKVYLSESLKPFAPSLRETAPGRFQLIVFSPRAGRLRIEKSTSAAGPFNPIPRQTLIRRGENLLRLRFDEKIDGYLRLHWN